MEARIDYLCDDDGDLIFEDGDLVVGQSDAQHIKDIVELTRGGDREHTTFGVDAIRYRNSSGRRVEFKRVVKEQLKADGYTSAQIEFDGAGLEDFTINVD